MSEEKKYSDGTFTKGRFMSFVKSALRKARWGPKYIAKKNAYKKTELNPKSGKMRKLYECAKCKGLFPGTEIEADHIEPVIGPEGFVNWDTYIERMFVDSDKFRALCKACHAIVTLQSRYNLSEEESIIRKQAIEFGKLSSTNQIKLFKKIGLEPVTSKDKRRLVYEKYLESKGKKPKALRTKKKK